MIEDETTNTVTHVTLFWVYIYKLETLSRAIWRVLARFKKLQQMNNKPLLFYQNYIDILYNFKYNYW